MPSTLFSSDSAKTHKRLVWGVLSVFIILFGLGYWLYHQTKVAEVLVPNIVDSLPPPTASSPEEVKSQYQTALAKVKTDAAQVTTTEEKAKILNDFFFSVRVPGEAREAHLAALLKFKSAKSAEEFSTILVDLESKIQSTPSTSL